MDAPARPGVRAGRAGLLWLPLAVLLVGAVLAGAQALWPGLRHLDDAVADAQWRWAAAPVPTDAVLVLDIDQASLQALAPALGGWPLRRQAYALVIDYLREAGARAVAIDLVLADGRDGDAELARVLRGPMPVVLAAAATAHGGEQARGPEAQAAAPGPDLPAAPATTWPDLLGPAGPLRAAAGPRVGMVSMPLDADGVLRRLPVLHEAGSLRLAALPVVVQQALAPGASLRYDAATQHFELGPRRWPADAQGRLRLPPPPAQALPRLPFQAVAGAALGQAAPAGLRAQLAGKVVFIGSSAALGNRVLTAAGQLSGAEWLAASHVALAAGRVARPASLASGVPLLVLAVAPTLLLCRRGRPAPLRDAVLAGVAALCVLALSTGALVLGQWQLPVLVPLAMLAAGALAALLAQLRADRAAAEQLRYERAVAEAASTAKSEFLASMSHELRTPLNGVVGACQLLQDQGADEHRREELLEILRASSQHLLGLVDGVLHLARIEAGVLELVREDFNLVDAVEAVMATAAPPARSKGLQIACVFDAGLPAWRHGDVARLRQVLLNLLGNAVKFTLHGEVVLRVAPGATPAALLLRVQDSGIGLTPEAQQRIFEPFTQADSGTTRRFGGSGLGLTISRKLVQAMGGTIAVTSTPGQGSCFSVALELPLAAQAGPEPEPLALRVAYIEPHPASAEALGMLLQRMGCQALRCDTPEALHAACAWPDERGRPAWLLVATDSPEALALLDTAVDVVEPQQVIGMSSLPWYAAESARERVRLPRSVTKPVLRSALVSRFGVGARPSARPGDPTVPDAPDAPAGAAGAGVPGMAAGRVLVVEDDAVNQTIVGAMLGQAGFQVEVAADGQQALRRCAEQAFDVLLMDWQMPDMDGIEVTRRLRAGEAGPAGRRVPVVALTANAFAEDRAACLAAGMNDFLSKPVVADDLIAVVSRWCQRGRLG
ncbi:MAG: CHASE2 domain-containing protein [Burkholderiales bacterium]|nr:CHASE2 domain-containing protein [Burkholderiales bacterium]